MDAWWLKLRLLLRIEFQDRSLFFHKQLVLSLVCLNRRLSKGRKVGAQSLGILSHVWGLAQMEMSLSKHFYFLGKLVPNTIEEV